MSNSYDEDEEDKDDDVYSEDNNLVEDDMISAKEEGFILGYMNG